ncbi:MAG: PIN domain-containing protein [Chloroflexi bacterium]|nr:PIN domain-containing protein [Chloroflexota bacterium]
MKLTELFQTTTRLFLDTAPVIYLVEQNPRYIAIVDAIFERVDEGGLAAVASPVTLAESLVAPYRLGRPEVAEAFMELLAGGEGVTFVAIDSIVAASAADFRARYNLSLPDALQAAVALVAGCDAFLTNDAALKRVTELRVITLDEVEPD